jgi:hypothetical protein
VAPVLGFVRVSFCTYTALRGSDDASVWRLQTYKNSFVIVGVGLSFQSGNKFKSEDRKSKFIEDRGMFVDLNDTLLVDE